MNNMLDFNPWWKNKNLIEDDFHLGNLKALKYQWNYKIIENLDNGIYSLRGPRQVGKTTWIKQKIQQLLETEEAKNIFYYSCDNVRDYSELITLINDFFEISKPGQKFIFLDEIPTVEEWQRGIKHLYDLGKFQDTFVLLSGSHFIDIKRSVERLPGRGDAGKRHFIMMPLSFAEYLICKKKDIKLSGKLSKDITRLKLNLNILNKEYNNYLLTGGFLKIINQEHISDASYDVYLKWIIGDLAKWNLKESFAKQIIRRIFESYTTELSWSRMKAGTDLDSHNTISKYVNALEGMFVLEYIYKMNFTKQIPDFPKSKKVYFSDPFIASACYKWAYGTDNHFIRYKEFLELNCDKISEGIILNMLIAHINKTTKSNIYDYKDKIFYWTNKAKTKEVDFIFDNTAFEVKYKKTIKSSDYKAIKEFTKFYLITRNTFDRNTIPISAFLVLCDQLL